MSNNRFNLSGKHVLVTGAGSGMGASISEAMAESGADVVCVDIVEKAAQETVRNISHYGQKAIPVKADAFEETDIKRMIATTTGELGSIDVVFAHAAIVDTTPTRLHDLSIDDWDRIASRYVRGIFMTMKFVFPIMVQQKSGCFITTSAATGYWPLPPVGMLHMAVPYITGKTAAIMLTKLAAKHYGEFGIRANVICPGYHRSRHHTEGPFLEEMEKFVMDCTSLKRVGLPDDIKGLAIFLASDASSFITGQIFTEDGGMMV
jgi:NAD(P)-dependent dehydrogenase (short-subunit alcohol dehydrogenase family)